MAKTTKESAKKLAWKWFSKWIREVRDCETCYTCGARNTQMNAGHYWHAVLDFDEENIHCQCVQCNKYNHGKLAEYGANLIRDLGEEKYRALEQRHYIALRGEYRSIQDYLDIAEKYQKLTKEHEQKYNIKY